VTPERLRELAQRGEKGESQRPLSDEELVRAVVCMANRPGSESGWILIGVEDDGRITGAHPRHGDRTDPLRLQALIANRTNPALSVRVFVVPLKPEGVEIVAIEVPPTRPLAGTTDGVYLRRAIGGRGEPTCLPMRPADFQSLQSARGVLDYPGLAVDGASWEDLDPLELERFRRFIRENPGRGDKALLELSDQELAKAIGAVEANHEVTRVRVLGFLLFGKEASLRRLLPTHEVAFQALRGQEVQVNEFFHYPQKRVMEEVLQRFRARYREEGLMVGLRRVACPQLMCAAGASTRFSRSRLILQYVRAHGRITRREAAELCQISSPQARDLLARLVRKGLLVRQGRRRGIFYVHPSTIVDVSKTEMDESTKSARQKKRRP
jgi:ATP-dependent DNA helicase RecG